MTDSMYMENNIAAGIEKVVGKNTDTTNDDNITGCIKNINENVSTNESNWDTIGRIGNYKQVDIQNWHAMTTYTNGVSVSPTTGKILYPRFATLSAKVGCTFFWIIDIGDGTPATTFCGYRAAGMPFERYFEGLSIRGNGYIKFAYLADSELLGAIWGGIEYYEVDDNE